MRMEPGTSKSLVDSITVPGGWGRESPRPTTTSPRPVKLPPTLPVENKQPKSFVLKKDWSFS